MCPVVVLDTAAIIGPPVATALAASSGRVRGWKSPAFGLAGWAAPSLHSTASTSIPHMPAALAFKVSITWSVASFTTIPAAKVTVSVPLFVPTYGAAVVAPTAIQASGTVSPAGTLVLKVIVSLPAPPVTESLPSFVVVRTASTAKFAAEPPLVTVAVFVLVLTAVTAVSYTHLTLPTKA